MKTTIEVDRERTREAGKIRRSLADKVRNGTLPVPALEELAELRAPQRPVA